MTPEAHTFHAGRLIGIARNPAYGMGPRGQLLDRTGRIILLIAGQMHLAAAHGEYVWEVKRTGSYTSETPLDDRPFA